MADTKRDQYMRLAGELRGVVNLVEQINVPHDNRRVHDLVESGQNLLRRAMLAAWESAETQEKNDATT